jgi:hypothetical protein
LIEPAAAERERKFLGFGLPQQGCSKRLVFFSIRFLFAARTR